MVVSAFESVGKWLAEQVVAAKLVSLLFRFVMGLYLFISAGICIRLFTGVSVVAQIVVWLILTTPLPLGFWPARAILRPTWRDALNCALLMLGTAYRVAGHASDVVVLSIMAYWLLVLLAHKRQS